MQSPRMVLLLTALIVFGLAVGSTFAQTHREIALERKFTGQGYSLCGSCSQPREISSTVQLPPADEPGEPVILTGTIFKKDGVSPDSGITLFLYQTDAGGYYHRPKEDVFHPRIYGWIRTDNTGCYEIHTIKPAPEIAAPNEPAHIHVHIFGKGIPEHFLHEFWFEGDTRITKEDSTGFTKLGSFSPIVTLKKGDDGIWRGTRNFRIRPAPQWKYEKD